MSPDHDKPTVAILGTGTMGAPMARNLLRAGLGVIAWNRTASKAEPLAADGARVAASAAEAAADADLLITMLADGSAVESVLEADGVLDAAPDDAIWIQMSTVGAAGIERLAALAAAHGTTFVDAPVLGSVGPATEGELVVLGSGPDEARARCAPAFEAMGRRTVWLGPAGEGSRLKVVVNAWLMAQVATLAETLALGEKLGVDAEWFLDVTDRGQVAAQYADFYGPAMAARELPLTFPLELAVKDTSLALEVAGEGAGLRVLEGTLAQYQKAAELGLGKGDWAGVIHAAAGDKPPEAV